MTAKEFITSLIVVIVVIVVLIVGLVFSLYQKQWYGFGISFLVLILILTILFKRSMRGLEIAKYHHLFQRDYGYAYKETGNKDAALKIAFKKLKYCPGMEQLTSEDEDVILYILGESSYPALVVEQIVMGFDSETMVKAFKDADYLRKHVSIVNKHSDYT